MTPPGSLYGFGDTQMDLGIFNPDFMFACVTPIS